MLRGDLKKSTYETNRPNSQTKSIHNIQINNQICLFTVWPFGWLQLNRTRFSQNTPIKPKRAALFHTVSERASKEFHTFSPLNRGYQIYFGEYPESENSITMVLQSYYCCCFPFKTSEQKLQNCSCSWGHSSRCKSIQKTCDSATAVLQF